MTPSLDALESFVAVADARHFTRAAAALHLAQPALTKRIQQLERDLGVRLLNRDRRAVTLTAEGEHLLPRAQQVLAAARDVVATTRRLREGELGRLRIGFTPSAPYHLLPVVMRTFRRRHAGIACVLSEMSSEEQLSQLSQGGLDVGILRPPVETPPSLICEPFFREAFVAVLPRDHALATRRTIALRELAGESFVLVARGAASAVHDQILVACAAAGFAPRVRQEGSQVHAVAGLVAAGCGVSVLPASAQHLRFPSLVYKPLRQSTLETVMALAYSRDAASTVRAFVTEACQAARARA